MFKQTTIKGPVSCYGIGVHSGERASINLLPAKENTGIVFKRTDVANGQNFIEANYKNVCDTVLSTSISNNFGVKVSTIEHLMAALWGCNIDNVIIEIDGPEVPIMDGSSAPFVFLIECAGMKQQNTNKKILQVNKRIEIIHQNAEVYLEPSEKFMANMEIDFSSRAIGKQQNSFDIEKSFKHELSRARTFGFMEDFDALKNAGLAKGASLDNAIGINGHKIMNPNPLRYDDEFVRHKLLDAIGDLNTSGVTLKAAFHGNKSGHLLNNEILHKLFEDQSNYSFL